MRIADNDGSPSTIANDIIVPSRFQELLPAAFNGPYDWMNRLIPKSMDLGTSFFFVMGLSFGLILTFSPFLLFIHFLPFHRFAWRSFSEWDYRVIPYNAALSLKD